MDRFRRLRLEEEIKNHLKDSSNSNKNKKEKTVSTGSTLLDLAISGGVYAEGGIPLGILVEIFGPSGSGKTVILSEIAGNVKRLNGGVMFHDPEARLNKQFARLFGLDIDEVAYYKPNTVTEVFKKIREWKTDNPIKGVFTDSLAALSTDLEMGEEEGDKMGMRRAKEFSEQLRKTCRILAERGILMVCSNQIRQNLDSGPFGQKYVSPGREAIGFYSSLRLRTFNPKKIKKILPGLNKKPVERVIGVEVEVEVYKNSIWKPFRTAPLTILFDYGIDDIRTNLQYLKDSLKLPYYQLGNKKLSNSLDKAVKEIEDKGLERELKNEVIKVWNDMERIFVQPRKPKFL